MKKRLLFITSQLPYPPVKGGVIVSWNLLKQLTRHFEVSLINVLKGEDPKFEQEMLEKVELAEYFSHELNVGRSPVNLLKSYAKGVPINFLRNYATELEDRIHGTINDFDYVIVDHYEMFQYIPDSVKPKVILHEHNAEFVMWQRYSEVSNNPAKKLVTGLESIRIRNKERDFCRKADLVLAFPNDREILEGIAEQGRFEEVMPCGDDEMLDLPDIVWDETEEAILYIGSLTWEANRDGLIWFIQEGWNSLKAKHPNLKFYIVGGNPDTTIQELAAQNRDIILTGFVDDLEDYYTKCRVFVSPLRFGSGIKIKVINAMLRGMPTSTTPIGAEGMPVENGVQLFSTQSMRQMVEDISLLLSDQDKWEAMKKESRIFAAEQFSWAKQVEKIKDHILALDEVAV
ncbi:MAG: glycosyltransferase family 4 protein [Bacteroidota bacterium]